MMVEGKDFLTLLEKLMFLCSVDKLFWWHFFSEVVLLTGRPVPTLTWPFRSMVKKQKH